jgi:hypothetical protein
MLSNSFKYAVFIIITVAFFATAALATAPVPAPNPGTGQGPDTAAYKGITKVKPAPSRVLKVKPYFSGLGGLSRFNPMNWWQQCCLPTPAKRQFILGPRVMFARLSGQARTGFTLRTAGTPPSVVDFDDHLKLSKSGNPIWSVNAYYQFHPRWGVRYSFTPISIEGSGTANTAFTFLGQTFTGGSLVRSKWQRYEHRAGLVFDLSHTVNSVTSVFAEWLYIQDRLTVGGATGTVTSVTWDDDKSMAVLGVEFQKCLRNYKGNTLAIGCKGSIAFLDDNIGYDAEASLSYLIPVKRGRFGFIKGGYRYANLKKEKDQQLFATTLDGAFVEVGFLF